jgi:autotransporter translocation and assembly factor TamB
MKRLLVLLLLLAVTFVADEGNAASAMQVNVTEPSGTYYHGGIPIKAQLLDNSGNPIANDDVDFRAALYKSNIKLDQITLGRSGEYYTGVFNILERGDYLVRFTVYWNDSSYTNSRSFKANSSQMYVSIAAPTNTTYNGDVPITVDVTMDNSFVHAAKVTAQISSKEVDVPEGQNHYSTTMTLAAGHYEVTVKAEKDGQAAEAKQSFSVSGEIIAEDNTTAYIPGPRVLTLKKITPDKGQYPVGDDLEISVMALDSQNVKMEDAMVTASVKTPSQTLSLTLPLKDDPVNPKYTATIRLSESGYYEAHVTATKEGYTNASAYFGPFRAGVALPEMPEDVVCGVNYCMRITSPSGFETYPTSAPVELRAQVIERTTITPVQDAALTVTIGSETFTLAYDWNGYYAISVNATEGEQNAEFLANWNGEVIKGNLSFIVSPHSLKLTPISPSIGQNVTAKFTTLQVKVTDEAGEIVTGANVRAIIRGADGASHTVTLERDVASGYYQSEYSFSGTGTHDVKLVASKAGFVSGEQLYSFIATMPEEQLVTTQDIIIIALIAGVIIIIATLWRALL